MMSNAMRRCRWCSMKSKEDAMALATGELSWQRKGFHVPTWCGAGCRAGPGRFIAQERILHVRLQRVSGQSRRMQFNDR